MNTIEIQIAGMRDATITRIALGRWDTVTAAALYAVAGATTDADKADVRAKAEAVANRMALASFLRGFAMTAGIDIDDADARWTFFSLAIPETNRRRIEAGGFLAGNDEGRNYRRMHA